MAILSDIIIADKREAAAINAASGGHLKQWDCLQAKGVDTVKLGTLSQILAGRRPDDISAGAFMTDTLLHMRSNEGPWVFLIPGESQSALAALDDDSVERVAYEWAATEECQLDGWKGEDRVDYLRELSIHARKAQGAGKSLLLWMCL